MRAAEPATARAGLTTGACAAAAAKAAALLLCGHPPAEQVEIGLPDGTRVCLPVEYAKLCPPADTAAGEAGGEPPPCLPSSVGPGFIARRAVAAVRKCVRGDPDATREVLVEAEVWPRDDAPGVRFEAGEGVGTVTLPGLSVPPGEPAINPRPRALIAAALAEVTDQGFRVRLSIPGGRSLARQTFNPRLGIEGGLSILGTSGWVRPYDREAVRETVRCAVRVALACGVTRPLLVPGNIGARAAAGLFPAASGQVIEVGNEWDAALEALGDHPLDGLLLVGHPGKLAKLCQGDWDTHSSRSASAVPFVQELARSRLGREPAAVPTVEGLFQGISSAERAELAGALAGEIQQAVGARTERRFPVSVAIVDMAGQLLGAAGELTPWR